MTAETVIDSVSGTDGGNLKRSTIRTSKILFGKWKNASNTTLKFSTIEQSILACTDTACETPSKTDSNSRLNGNCVELVIHNIILMKKKSPLEDVESTLFTSWLRGNNLLNGHVPNETPTKRKIEVD